MVFPGTQPYAMTSKKNCDSDAQGCAQLNGNHEVIAKPSRLRTGQARPSRKTTNLYDFAKIREVRACRDRGFAIASLSRHAIYSLICDPTTAQPRDGKAFPLSENTAALRELRPFCSRVSYAHAAQVRLPLQRLEVVDVMISL